MVTGVGGAKLALGTVKLKGEIAGPGAGLGLGGVKGTEGGGGLVRLSNPSKNSPIFVVFIVSSTGLGGEDTLPALAHPSMCEMVHRSSLTSDHSIWRFMLNRAWQFTMRHLGGSCAQ